MMHEFLAHNREELVARCTEKVAKRPKRNATPQQLKNGIPLFLEQLRRTLQAEQEGYRSDALRISGASGGIGSALSEMGVSAAAHGKELLALAYNVNQVVHDYGDLCQAITDLAFERDAPFSVDEFRTLNRCLDNSIADAVTEFSFQRDTVIAEQQSIDMNERLGFLMHELRNSLTSATLAVDAIELGNLSLSGATGAVLKRSLSGMDKLIVRSLSEVRVKGSTPETHQMFSLAAFIAEAAGAAQLDANTRGCVFTVADVSPLLGMVANRDLMSGALANLLHNAFKFTHHHTEVKLNAYPLGDRVLIEVADNCGGLPHGDAEKMFSPFTQRNNDKTGLGLGLSIARQSVAEYGGFLTVMDTPGVGCTFTISLPRYTFIPAPN
ncbi:MAG: histidine kinase [Herminiimonas sp.]|nr:histidine kinase [Herminiimonas sp.]